MSVDDNGPALIIHRLKKLGFNVQITPSPGLIEILFLSSLGKSPATRNGSLARYKDGTAGWQPHLRFLTLLTTFAAFFNLSLVIYVCAECAYHGRSCVVARALRRRPPVCGNDRSGSGSGFHNSAGSTPSR
jgi:hypothetical protein